MTHAAFAPAPDPTHHLERGVRDRLSHALVRTGGICMIAAGVMVVVPALDPERVSTVVPHTEPVAQVMSTPVADAAALAMLREAAAATRTKTWHGTQLVSVVAPAATTTAMVSVAHLPGVGTWTATQASASVTNGTSRTFEPESAQSPTGEPTDWLSLVTAHYSLAREGERTVGATTAQSLLLSRADGTAAARIFIDPDDDLIVGRELYDLQGKLLRASAFSAISVTTSDVLADAGFSPATALAASDNGEKALSAAALTTWRARGWTIPTAVSTSFGLVDARASGTGPTDSSARLHLTYSDGLSTVSLFAERGKLVPSELEGWHSTHRSGWPVVEYDGVHDQVTWSDGTRVWSIVADAPSQVVDTTVAALPHQRNRAAYTRRFHGGLTRIGSWFNPLG